MGRRYQRRGRRKSNKISFVFVLVIIGIIGLCIVSFNLTKKDDDKDNNTSNNTNNSSNSTSNNTQLSSEVKKVIENNEEDDKPELSTLTEEERTEIGKEKTEKFLSIYKNNSPKGILVTLGLLEKNHEFSPEDYFDRFFVKTNIKYEDFENVMLRYMTVELFNEYYHNQGFKEKDGYLAISDIGEEILEFELTDLDLKKTDGNKKIYDITYKNKETGETEKTSITVIVNESGKDYVVEKYEKDV